MNEMSYARQSENSLVIEKTGKSVDVSENAIAKLMYYLSCVNGCIDVGFPSRCTDYKNYKNVTFDDKIDILKFAKYFSPNFMNRNGIFINEPDLCQNSTNEFYKITAKKKEFTITTSFIYASREIHTLEFMTYKVKWMNENYNEPIQEFSSELRAIENDTIEEIRPRNHSYDGSNKPIALLMYYLSCVDACISFNIPNKLKNYKNYSGINFDDEIQILTFAEEFKPSILTTNGAFVNKLKYCGNYTNKFYEISQLESVVSYKKEFNIGNKRVRTVKFMVFASSWVEKFYKSPMKTFSKKIEAINNGTIEILRPRRHSYNGPNEPLPCLMYYLSCVNNLIDLEIPNDLMQYKNYQNLSTEKENQIVSFALNLGPEFFIEKNLMINDLLICGNYTNKFYNVSELSHKNPMLEFNFANKLIHSQKVMIFDEKWIQDFYKIPMMSQKERLEAFRKGQIKSYKPKNRTQSSSDSKSSTNDKNCLIQ
ncbi:hypothetical protein M9Y10_016147 [Tritrichomonas musculus]|uniref:Uncharacterized protein n=1 Tax=Tritrichomonas musculus TaxID=1915356 RepID=A0ABR2I5F4_9EUKA